MHGGTYDCPRPCKYGKRPGKDSPAERFAEVITRSGLFRRRFGVKHRECLVVQVYFDRRWGNFEYGIALAVYSK